MNIAIITETLLQEQAITPYILCKIFQSKFQFLWDKFQVGLLTSAFRICHQLNNKIVNFPTKAN